MPSSIFRQLVAVLYKNTFLQLRQRKTVVFQILIPVFFVFFYGWFNLLLPTGVDIYYSSIGDTMTYDPGYTHDQPKSSNQPKGNGIAYAKAFYVDTNSGDSAGYMSNTTLDDKNDTGLLGSMPKWWYYDDDLQSAGVKDSVISPNLVQYSSLDEVDNYIFNTANRFLYDELMDDESDIDYLALPTNALAFLDISYESGVLKYTMEAPNNKQLKDLWPHFTALHSSSSDHDYDTWAQFMMSLVHTGFARETTGKNITIWSGAETLLSVQEKQTVNVLPMLGMRGSHRFICIPPALSFIFPVIVYSLVVDVASGLLEMSKLKGLTMIPYWIANYIFFSVAYSFIMMFVFICGIFFQIEFVRESYTVTIPLCLVWGLAQISTAFFLAPLFKKDRVATIVSYGLVFLGIAFAEVLNLFLFSRRYAAWWYYLVPPWVFVRGVYLLQESYTNFRPLTWTENWDPEMTYVFGVLCVQVIIFGLVGMYLMMVMPRNMGRRESVFFPIVWMWRLISRKETIAVDDAQPRELHSSCESSDFSRNYTPADNEVFDEDEDCLRERLNVCSTSDRHRFLLQVRKCHKKYGNLIALRSFCLGIESGECFGLLGPNGAGKTTLISILCGMQEPTDGFSVVNGYRTDTEIADVRSSLGYCPQHDLVWDDLTIAEHIHFFSLLVGPGHSDREVPSHVKQMNLIETVGLQDHMHKRSSELSGGMKRRLSIANALVGSPELLLLDEPTTGLDPESRREIWDIISDVSIGRGVLVSTHNMEEADILCSRIGIMSAGRLVALGNQQYLKSKFGSGYTVTMTVPIKNRDQVIEFFLSTFPSSRLDSAYGGVLSFIIPGDDIDMAFLFRKMKMSKSSYGVLEWGVNQTSLEDVFLQIVRRDENEDENIDRE